MREDEFEALLEVIVALVKAMKNADTEKVTRFNALKQEFINVQIFGDAPVGGRKE